MTNINLINNCIKTAIIVPARFWKESNLQLLLKRKSLYPFNYKISRPYNRLYKREKIREKINMNIDVKKRKSLMSSNKAFGILFFIVFLIYGIWPVFSLNEIRLWSLIIGLIFLILGLLNSKFLTPFNKIWLKLGIVLGKVISPTVMAIIYFFVITPIGIIMKLFGKDLLKVKFKNDSSYWIDREKNIGSMKKQF